MSENPTADTQPGSSPDGTSGVVAYHIPTDTTVVIFVTYNPKSNDSVGYATLAFQRLAAIVTPSHVPTLHPCLRGC
jgi:hypothetical protein